MIKTIKVRHPKGPRIKVRVSKYEEEVSAGGLVIAKAINHEETEEENGEHGIVVELGHCAYGNFTQNWCELGSEVYFQRFAGKPFEEMGVDGKIGYYRIIKDIDVIATVEDVHIIESKQSEGEKCQTEKN